MAKYRIGIDLGGTKLAVGIVDQDWRIVAETVSHDHTCCDEEGILDRMARNIDDALGKIGATRSEAAGVGVLFPGHVRWPEGITLTTSNLPCLKGYPLREALQRRLGMPVIVDNDANAQALAEHRFGAGRGTRNMVFLTVSTGVGGGIIINGEIYRGATGTAGEFGHMIVAAGSDAMCTCGNRGCLMALASGIAMRQAAARNAAVLEARGQTSDLPASCPDIDDLDGERLRNGILEDNQLCRSIAEEFGTYIGIGIYNIFQILNPELIVIGGGLLNLPDLFLETARKVFREKARDMMHDELEIRNSELGSQAGMLGAAAILRSVEDSLGKA
jgi:glucokinase